MGTVYPGVLGEVSIVQFKTGVVSVEGTQVGVVRDEEVTVLVQAVGLVKFIVTRRLVVKVDQHPVTRKLVAVFPPKERGAAVLPMIISPFSVNRRLSGESGEKRQVPCMVVACPVKMRDVPVNCQSPKK